MSNAFQLVMSLAGIAYAILPFALSVWLLAGLWNACDRSRYRNMFISAVAGAGCFCLAGTAISAWNFDLFIAAHALLLALSLSAAIIINRKRRLVLPSLRPAAAMAAVVAGSGVVRALPFLIGEPSLGGGDARFHLILVEKIIRDRCLAASWLPFAQAAVSYPQGSHVLVAFVADVFRLPPHWVFNTAIAFFGAMTTGMIGVLAASSFGSRTSGLWAAASYAFLALQGGLDYHRWGGLPNCLGMLFVLLSVHLVLFGRPLPGARAMLAEFAASLLLVCALMVTPIALAPQVSSVWMAVLLVGMAAAGHQGWAANMFAMISDLYPTRAVSSAAGIAGFGGSVGGMFAATATGLILHYTGSYWPLFIWAGGAYLLILGIIHAAIPRIQPLQME